VGIGTPTPIGKLSIYSGTFQTGFLGGLSSPDAGSIFYTTDNTGWKFSIGKYVNNNYYKQFTIQDNGNVGIGTTTPSHLLSVNGSIRAKEVIVDLCSELGDFVFHPTYTLMPLPEVEQYVKTNSHLPQMPSASEVSKNGLNMGEMQNKLLQKVEELTLYIIELQKTNEKQNAKINELEKKIK
jgi:hypothetical protein